MISQVSKLDDFNEIWSVDFEYGILKGGYPDVRCFCAVELRSGRKIKLWQDELKSQPNFFNKNDVLVVAYYGLAEMSCIHQINWQQPLNFIDAYVEFVKLINGKSGFKKGLLEALKFFNIHGVDSSHKEEMRQMAIRGGDYYQKEKEDLLEYCLEDCVAVIKLLETNKLLNNLGQALFRGEYIKALSFVERNGIPIDVSLYNKFLDKAPEVRDLLISDIDQHYGVFESGSFRKKLFESYLLKNDIPWPRLSSTELDLKTETFKEMALLYPEIAPLKELRSTLSQIRNNSLAIGPDGRNRCMLSPFKSKTGRNQPSNSEFIFGASSWSRSLIRPEKGFALAYIDWCQQEHGIAAFLSNDTNMIKAYKSGDPYLEFAKQAGSVPPDATKQSHRNERDLFKQTALAVQYGMGAESLARKIKSTEDKALWLLNLHRKTYPTFWKWSDSCLDFAGINGFLYTVFGWPVHIESDINIRSVRNFPMQANGAEMLRLACILLVKENIRVCATVHDAILIESKIEDIEATVKRAQALMAKASSVVLSGFKLKSDVKIVKYPDRFVEERGQFIWNKILNIIDEERCIESVTPSVRP